MFLGKAIVAGKALWSLHLRTTIYADGKPAFPGAPDKDALKLKFEEYCGKDMENLTKDAGTRSVAERKDAVHGFSSFLTGLDITERPSVKDKQAVCVLCARVAACNATDWLVHIASKCVVDHPDKAAASLGADNLKTTANTMGTVKLESLKGLASETKAELATKHRLPSASGSASQAHLPGAAAPSIRQHLDRELPDEEVQLIDEMLARFCFGEGLPFRVLSSSLLLKALTKLNASWAKKTKLTPWTIRHSFLNNESDSIDARVQAAIVGAYALTLLSDGWSGHQKQHLLNVLITTPRPFFLFNIHTYAARVTGEYQVCALRGAVSSRGARSTPNAYYPTAFCAIFVVMRRLRPLHRSS